VTKWEYLYKRASEWEQGYGNGELPDIDALDGLGSAGWELVAIAPAWGNDPLMFIFKRPLIEKD